jgi:hypothetical protein
MKFKIVKHLKGCNNSEFNVGAITSRNELYIPPEDCQQGPKHVVVANIC